MNEKVVLPDTGGVTVTLIEANHCPGSCLFFFEGKQTVNAGDSTFHSAFVGTARVFRYLHCGDFRACPQQAMHPEIRGKRLDLVYLDTTYLDPKYCFPPQRMVIDACTELAVRIVKNGGDTNLLEAKSSGGLKNYVKSWLGGGESEEAPKEEEEAPVDSVLVVVGTYTIGKERVVKSIARALGTKIYCESRKKAFFECQSQLDPELMEMVGDDPTQCQVHVCPLSDITSDRLLEYLELWKGRWKKVVGLRPTGWTYTPPAGTDTVHLSHIIQRDQNRQYNWSYLRPMRNSTSTVMLYGVPYSEHSSFFELTCFALSVNYVRMIATVNVGSAKSRTKMNGWFEKWESEKKRRYKEGIDAERNGIVAYRHEEYW
ncbi:DRMBL-domain-containing protein [Serendipita vermifera]|nr:DRMBL-domain-containing protein [Serendipita vermifera]